MINCVELPQEEKKPIHNGNNTSDTDTDDYEFRGYYKFRSILGKGAFGTVIECVRKRDEKPVAIKFIKTRGIYKWISLKTCYEDENDDIYKEVVFKPNTDVTENSSIPVEVACLLRAFKLDGIIKIIEYWSPFSASFLNMCEDHPASSSDDAANHSPNETDIAEDSSNDKFVAIVFERNYNEVSLYDYLFDRECLKEAEAKEVFKQIVDVSLNLLNINILHGDLKCENMLIDCRTKKLQLIDFGSAVLLDCNPKLCAKTIKAFRGTNLYKPPEYVLHHSFYARPSTVWTFGIILYNLVCGDFPFQNENEILEHKDKELNFTNTNLSSCVKDLIRRCLSFYTADRIIIEKVLTHTWLTQ